MSPLQGNQEQEEYDLIIIGAGLYGIAAARYYLEVHANSNVVILEADEVVGGTWSKKRMYDEFWTQTPLGMAEFSDLPLHLPREAQTYHGFFRGLHVTDYLEKYVDLHVYGGRSIRQRIRFNQQVSSVEKDLTGKWKLHCNHSQQTTLWASKLIVTSGLTSTPHEPILPNRDIFSGEIIHQKSFGQIESLIRGSEKTHIAVLGGGKSAADIVYSAVKDGKSVSWIIREHGSGPSGQGSAAGKGPYQNSVAMFSTRLFSSFSPSIFRKQSMWEWLLYGTKAGRALLDWIWRGVDKRNRKMAGYRTRNAMRNGEGSGFEMLEPDTPFFWQNDSSGICQRPDFWSVVADSVHVYRSDVLSLHSHAIELCDSSLIPVDIIICATGWESSLNFFSSEEKARMGLPVHVSEDPASSATEWENLETCARKTVLQRFPTLANPPPHYRRERTRTPYRLYKCIAPINGDRTIVFPGHIHLGHNFITAEAQALWALAYLDGRLELPTDEQKAWEVSKTIAWCRLRYLEKGWDGNYFYFDMVPYVDMLLCDSGLSSHRRSWLKTQTAPLMAQDLKPLCQEYIQKSPQQADRR